MILFIDNYDSFVFNLVQYISRYRQDYIVARNDEIDINNFYWDDIDKIIISPGPKGPDESGVSIEVIKKFGYIKPILGICLGHQCIGSVFGMPVTRAQTAVHGKASEIFHSHSRLFKNIPQPFNAARYHSLVVKTPVNPDIKITAYLKDGTIMGMEHKYYPLFGVQFHPESILTPDGRTMLKNFLDISNDDYPNLGDETHWNLSTDGYVNRYSF